MPAINRLPHFRGGPRLPFARVRFLRIALMLAVLTACYPPLEGVSAEAGKQMAIDYYRTLAEAGSADAQLTLGDLYSNGDGVAQDLVEAYAWYYLAAQQGLEEAIHPMNAVLRALPKSQWELAKERAEAYEKRFLQNR